MTIRFRFVARLGLVVLAVALTTAGCGDEAPSPAADHTFGTTEDALDATPAPAVAAEPNRYNGRRTAVEGRIAEVVGDGCTIRLATAGEMPLYLEAARSDDGTCAWRVPGGTTGIALAAGTLGTLRAAGDTLRLTSNGVRVTPVRLANSDS